MKLKDVKILFEETFGELLLVGYPKEIYGYENGKRTDTFEMIGYPIISTKLWEKMTVKIKEKTPSVEFTGQPIPVTLKNVDAKLWQDFNSNELKISVIADGIILAAHNKIKINREE